MRSLCVLLVAAGCYAPHVSPGAPCGAGEPCPLPLTCSAASSTCELASTDATIADAPPLDTPDGTSLDARLCFGTGLVQVCLASAPAGTLTVDSPLTVDTNSHDNCTPLSPGNPQLCVMAAETILISSTLAATGKRPLVLIATGAIIVSGNIDVASHRGGMTGAGADASQCNAGTAPVAPGGGEGGSFGSRGGNGGAGLPSGIGGDASASVGLAVLQGGCPGTAGATTGLSGSTGGHGGGSVYLISTDQITVTGTIDASGEGGSGCTGTCGGGGGGTGGVIGFDAPTLVGGDGAKIFANGGGGGEGASTSTGNPGADPTSPTSAAPGGSGGTMTGGDGGAGAFGTTSAGPGGNGTGTTGGGGGGAGGVGIIKLFGAPSITGTVSPPPS